MILTLCFTLAATVAAPQDSVRVLFVGNSLTYWNEMPWMTTRVAESLQAKPRLKAVFNGAGGMSLRQHWERGRALEAIRELRWDYVVLQPQSSEILRRPDETAKYARLFHDAIQKKAARTVLFLTWIPLDSGSNQRLLTEQYRKLAHDLGATVAPVGVAWERLTARGYRLYDGSGVHPTLAGSYLAACVFYAVIYGKSPHDATHRFDLKFDIPEVSRSALEKERIDWATAEAIQREAWAAVKP